MNLSGDAVSDIQTLSNKRGYRSVSLWRRMLEGGTLRAGEACLNRDRGRVLWFYEHFKDPFTAAQYFIRLLPVYGRRSIENDSLSPPDAFISYPRLGSHLSANPHFVQLPGRSIRSIWKIEIIFENPQRCDHRHRWSIFPSAIDGDLLA